MWSADPNLSPGYWRDPEGTRAAFAGEWFRTGDCGYFDEDGFLFLTGRVREFINRGGEKVSPAEIDEILGQHPGVKQVLTFAVTDRRLGEEVAVAVVPKQQGAVSGPQMRRYAAARLAFHKVPRHVFVVDEIPLGRTGKPSRAALRERFDQQAQGPPVETVLHVRPRTPLEDTIARLWSDTLGVADPGIHDNFFESGGDMAAADLFVARLRSEIAGKDVQVSVLMEAPTIAELALNL